MEFTPLLAAIDSELRKQVSLLERPFVEPFHAMLTYHMGWTGQGAGPEVQGKRIRPLLVLLTSESCGTPWLRALPAAASVELIHNFSLVHDDIQDASEKRHGRATVWATWGAPLAINVGDALFVAANQSILDLARDHPAEVAVKAGRILNDACLELTRGQYLDMTYEGHADLGLENYWPMVRGKTAALLAACCHIGALVGGAQAARQESFRSFGEHLGLAFQVQDDILGIWGDEHLTGKSVAGDLVDGKNSLPVLYGLSLKGKFAERWKKGPIDLSEVDATAQLLADEGAHEFARAQAGRLTARALQDLQDADPQGEAGQALFGLADKLLNREQ